MNGKNFFYIFLPIFVFGLLVFVVFRTAQTQMKENSAPSAALTEEEAPFSGELPAELPDSVPPAPISSISSENPVNEAEIPGKSEAKYPDKVPAQSETLLTAEPVAQSVSKPATLPIKERTLEEIPFDGTLAQQFTTELCAIGPRPSGSEGMKRQQEYIIAHFSKCGAAVELQRFQFPYPGSAAQKVTGTNLIFRWKPERKERILLCGHYDTLPLPTENPPETQHLPFVGAVDNAGGIAILMVLGQMLPEILEKEQTRYGVDVVMLDAEEFMFRKSRNSLPNERFCWGSEFFGRKYASETPEKRGFTYVAGVLLDMVSQHGVHLRKEQYSFQNRETRPIVNEIWNTARKLNVREFDSRLGNPITDDHIYLYEFGKIPVIDIIDLEYSPWHTHEDTPDKCSPLSAARVGWVVSEWLREKK